METGEDEKPLNDLTKSNISDTDLAETYALRGGCCIKSGYGERAGHDFEDAKLSN